VPVVPLTAGQGGTRAALGAGRGGLDAPTHRRSVIFVSKSNRGFVGLFHAFSLMSSAQLFFYRVIFELSYPVILW